MQTSCQPWADLVPTLGRPHAKLVIIFHRSSLDLDFWAWEKKLGKNSRNYTGKVQEFLVEKMANLSIPFV